MKRQLLVSLVVLFGISTVSFAQATRTRSEDSERCYVIVERTGFDVNCTVLPSQQEVNNRIAQLKKDNSDIAKANKPIEDEVKKLVGQLAAKKRALANAKEDAKADLQKEVDDLTSQIAEKKAEIKPYVTWANPVHFSKQAEADKYIMQVTKQAEADKEKAAKIEAEKAAKEAEKEAKKKD
jgi:hypothetical protein